jgi:hypothetical protein
MPADSISHAMTRSLSQIHRLLKNILLCPESLGKRASAQFMPGRERHGAFTGGIAATWWYTERTFEAADAVAALTVQANPTFANCELKFVSSVVMQTLQEKCGDEDLFDVGAVLFKRSGTLFGCAAVPPLQLAQAIQSAIAHNLISKIGRHCTIYAAPRIKCSSFHLEEEEIRLVAKDDAQAWGKVKEQNFALRSWTPAHPTLDSQADSAFSPNISFQCVLASEDLGTPTGSEFNGILKFRKLAALLHATVCKTSGGSFSIAQGLPSNFIIQFPHTSIAQGAITRRQCAPILPFLSEPLEILDGHVSTVRAWYILRRRCSTEVQGRLDKGANFLNRGLNAADIEAFINYFIALDALFGERGSVEASILRGVKVLSVEKSLKDKASWLFDLRNELVHGGGRYITEWPSYGRYRRHFRSDPLDDVRKLAQAAILEAPALYAL